MGAMHPSTFRHPVSRRLCTLHRATVSHRKAINQVIIIQGAKHSCGADDMMELSPTLVTYRTDWKINSLCSTKIGLGICYRNIPLQVHIMEVTNLAYTMGSFLQATGVYHQQVQSTFMTTFRLNGAKSSRPTWSQQIPTSQKLNVATDNPY